ncbi:3460_t:CDS:1 [Funneliformis mosseae]|uniref:3460_t:CDS:1 n=1 Tax=Funneliformis mosseae TaxID=27381 RepID=A0A9N9BAS0_FUNMO|nr:3460_t:CDS:1 [Funneliformis mosseae]
MNLNNLLIPPHHNNAAQLLAAQVRNGRIRILTGMDLLKQNIKYEANRLHVYGRYIIDLATNRIWHHHLSTFQRQQFITLANSLNGINRRRASQLRMTNNVDTLNRISQITLPQAITSTFENNFFNGINFP